MAMPVGPGAGNDVDRWRMPSYAETEPRWLFNQTDRNDMANAASAALLCLNLQYEGQTFNFSDYNQISSLLDTFAPVYEIKPPFMDVYPVGYTPQSAED